MALNEEQADAFTKIQSQKNIFLTGPAGSGKSFLIRHIMEWAPTAGKNVSVVALTGCAALLLGKKAKTLHSWAGIGLGAGTTDTLIKNILKKPKLKRAWKKTDILIIDEISMMPPDLYEKLDAIAKQIRASDKPWGGIQLVLCGDFFQLPPVLKGVSGEVVVGRFAFECEAWKNSRLLPVVLTRIERQTDPKFQQMLNECRIGSVSAETIALLKTRQGLDWKSRLIRPTLLFSRNADVDTINEKNIEALKKPLQIFTAETTLEPNPDDPDAEMPTGEFLMTAVDRLDKDANYCSKLAICVGAQVMLLVNKDIERGLVNGSRGVVVDFAGGEPVVQFLNGLQVRIGKERWTSAQYSTLHREQIPLRVAYAITIHKSQGATLDCALIDIGSSTFECGQAYVALSRVRDIESLYIHTIEAARIRAHPTVIRFYETLMDMPTVEEPKSVIKLTDFGADLSDGWKPIVQAWAATEIGASCIQRVAERRAAVPVFPAAEDVLNALRFTPLDSVRVVLLGQDPYHGPGQAHGLSFSVRPGTVMPPSLKNIRKELVADLGKGEAVWSPTIGSLTQWARRGVLLLNTVLTVEQGNPASHGGIGWEGLTQKLLEAVVQQNSEKPVVFLAWGKFAQNILYKLTLGPKHCILAAVHPSPLSAHSGFFGSKPFSKANDALAVHGAEPVLWTIADTADEVEDPTV